MRTYTFLASRPGGYMNWPGAEISTQLRKRAVAVVVFRKWFGREPTTCWSFWGMSVASDERGNEIEINQINAYNRAFNDIFTVPARTGICDACGKRRLWHDLREVNCAPVSCAMICWDCRTPKFKEAA